jgi:hypothetical protein
VSPSRQQPWRDLVAARVAEACPGLGTGLVCSAVSAAAPSAKALSVLARALGPGPGALVLGAPPVVGRLVSELRARGAALAEPVCARCGRAQPKLAVTGDVALCRRCRARHNAAACGRCGVVKVVYGRGPAGEALCSVCAPRPERRCSRCGRVRPIVRRAHDGQGELCGSCFHGPVATCSVCGRHRPCNFVAVGRPVCMTCSPRRPSRCAHCGNERPACARWPEGPVCEPCYRAALSRRGTCEACGAERRLVSPPGPRARLCAGCAGAPPLATCRSCGAEERLYIEGCCVRCALATRAAELTGGPQGQLAAVYEAIVAAPQPYSAHNWLRRSASARLLREVASGQLALTHEDLDAHPARRGADYLRHLLVANGVLATRDDALVRLETWVAGRLADVEDKAQHRLLRSYARWRVLRRARQRAEAAGAPRTATRYAKVNLGSAIAFVGFLAARQTDLAAATQADLDDWLAEGPPSAPEVRDFLGWAADRRLAARFDLPGRARQVGPVAADDERWATARSLLHDEDIDLADRVAGLLVLLYGQQLSRITTLSRDQVELTSGGARLHLGASALEVPPPLQDLLARLVNGRRPFRGVGSPTATPWLFPGLDPGLPLTAGQLGQRLRRLGIEPAAGRRCALAHLAGSLPAAVVAQALGITPGTAVRWAGTVGADWAAYAAAFARSASTGS